jgi:hypothetical protein
MAIDGGRPMCRLLHTEGHFSSPMVAHSLAPGTLKLHFFGIRNRVSLAWD